MAAFAANAVRAALAIGPGESGGGGGQEAAREVPQRQAFDLDDAVPFASNTDLR